MSHYAEAFTSSPSTAYDSFTTASITVDMPCPRPAHGDGGVRRLGRAAIEQDGHNGNNNRGQRSALHGVNGRSPGHEVPILMEEGLQEVIVAHLVRRPTSTRSNIQAGAVGWTSTIRREGGPGADPGTIEFVKSKSFPSCQLHSVSFINPKGWTMHVLIKTWREHDGTWRVRSCGGGAGPHPHRSRPWVNFAAGFGHQDFTGGGHVVGDGAENARSVRLAFANAIVIEDTIDNGVVLFFEPHAVVAPAEVSIVDSGGAALVTYREFDDFAP